MARYSRSIKIAFDKLSGEILDADEIFDITKDAFQIRKKYHEKNLELSCCECEQDLMVSGSKYDRLHFKHKPGHEFCILANGQFSPLEQEKFTAILKAKESKRHKDLKKKIGKLLENVKEVDKSSIQIDNKFIIKGNERRKPDVYCKFQDKEIVFEIQLSDLSLGYILSRYDFYKKNGIYLIWILDNFDLHNQGTLERDIKYLTKYENFFKLDESSETFRLLCDYKYPFLTDKNKLLTKWLKKSIFLNELNFDSEVFQTFYYNFGDHKLRTENLQKQRIFELEESERKRKEIERLEKAEQKAKDLVINIADFRRQKLHNFSLITNKIEKLNNLELILFNKILNLKGRNKPPLLTWIDKASQDDVGFLNFIITTKEIEIDIIKSHNGRTAFQALFENSNISKFVIAQALFQVGYKLTENDKTKLIQLKEKEEIEELDFHCYFFCDRLKNRTLAKNIFDFIKLLLILESARNNDLIYFKYNGNKWISFANNAIQYYSEYWEYIELTFKHFGTWDELIKIDTNGTFQKKVEQFYSKMPIQKYDFDRIFKDLFPEIE